MDGVTIRGGREGEAAALPWLALPLLYGGTVGALLLFRGLDGVSFSMAPALAAAALVLCLFRAGERYGGRWFAPLLIFSGAAWYALGGRARVLEIGAEAGRLLGFWFGGRFPGLAELFGETAPEDVTALAMTLAAALGGVLYVMEYLCRDHEIANTAVTALLIYTPLLGLGAGTEALFLLGLFALAGRTVQQVSTGGFRNLLPPGKRTRLAALCTALLCAALALAFLAAVPLTERKADALFAPAYRGEALAVKGLRSLERTWQRARSGSEGQMQEGNQYRDGTLRMELAASARPMEPLYLRSFSGGDYTGGAWDRADDTALFRAVQADFLPDWDPEEWISGAAQIFDGMYFELNGEMQGKLWNRLLSNQSYGDEEFSAPALPASARALGIWTVQSGGAYRPYYSWAIHLEDEWEEYEAARAKAARSGGNGGSSTVESSSGGSNGSGSGVSGSGGSGGYVPRPLDEGLFCRYYQQNEMHVDWSLLGDSERAGAYHRLQEAYLREAEQVYTRVPEELVPRLAELVRENPLSDLNEITAFIIHTLHSRAVYSLTPGRTAGNRDMVEDFLFERGRGYCQHFAAAATLLYRLYGVPARYCVGFVALPTDFSPYYPPEETVLLPDGTVVTEGGGGRSDGQAMLLPDGTVIGGEAADAAFWYARISDASAHAWTEIFLDGYGWTPVEATPASRDSAAGMSAQARYPGYDRETQAELFREHGWANTAPSPEGEDAGGGLDGSGREDSPSPDGGNGPDSPSPYADDAAPSPDGGADGPNAGNGRRDGEPPATLRNDGTVVNYLVFLLFTVLLLAPPVLVSRRNRRLERLDAMDCREAVWRLSELLRFAGTPVDEEAADYPARLNAAVPSIETAEAERLVNAAERAAYGPSGPGEAEDRLSEDRFARQMYRRAAGWLYGGLDWRRRAAFRWGYVFG